MSLSRRVVLVCCRAVLWTAPAQAETANIKLAPGM